MVLDQRTVERRLSELDQVIAELRRMTDSSGEPLTAAALDQDLSLRWSLERGLLAAANLVIDTANHIAAGHFAVHPDTYEDGLRLLAARKVVDDATYGGMRGLGGFGNVLAHDYLDIDLEGVLRWRSRLLEVLPTWITEVTTWLDGLPHAEQA